MKFIWVLVILCGIWFVASSMTEEGLLPSGHGVGWVSGLVIGLAAIGYGAYRLGWGGRKSKNA